MQKGGEEEEETGAEDDEDLRATFIRATPVDGTLVLTQDWSAS